MKNEGDSTDHSHTIRKRSFITKGEIGRRFGGQTSSHTFSIGVGLEWSARNCNGESGNYSECTGELHGDEGQGETFIQKVGVFYMVPIICVMASAEYAVFFLELSSIDFILRIASTQRAQSKSRISRFVKTDSSMPHLYLSHWVWMRFNDTDSETLGKIIASAYQF